jgi:hypothetical protein
LAKEAPAWRWTLGSLGFQLSIYWSLNSDGHDLYDASIELSKIVGKGFIVYLNVVPKGPINHAVIVEKASAA